ncbi:MAG: hypothetical protein AAGA84_02905 [Pseudomonadota bacterium]
MDTLIGWIESGTIVDVMLVVVAIEIVVLAAFRLTTGKGISLAALLLNIGAGGSLMVALKLVFSQAGWQWVAMALVASLIFHVSDLAWRWRASRR